jgi:formylglycine-generating enzyme required for sulfatase activity
MNPIPSDTEQTSPTQLNASGRLAIITKVGLLLLVLLAIGVWQFGWYSPDKAVVAKTALMAASQTEKPVQLATESAGGASGMNGWQLWWSSVKDAVTAKIAPQPPQLELLKDGEIFRDCPDCPEMVVIPGGTFVMGSSEAEQALAIAAGVNKEWTDHESPQHKVSVHRYAMGRYSVTKSEFGAFVRDTDYQTEAEKGKASTNWRNVGFKQGDDHPVVYVSWDDAQAYIRWISQRTKKQYRLPSESEREYATRAGTQTAFWWGDSISTSQANYNGMTGLSYNDSPQGGYRHVTVPVNSFQANPWGLYNMHGNVWEWVEDCFYEDYRGAPTDGSARTTGCGDGIRVLRGSSWVYYPAYLRSAYRYRLNPFDNDYFDVGFRLARTLLK